MYGQPNFGKFQMQTYLVLIATAFPGPQFFLQPSPKKLCSIEMNRVVSGDVPIHLLWNTLVQEWQVGRNECCARFKKRTCLHKGLTFCTRNGEGRCYSAHDWKVHLYIKVRDSFLGKVWVIPCHFSKHWICPLCREFIFIHCFRGITGSEKKVRETSHSF